MQDHIKNFNNEITRIYGEPATGKTTIALMSTIPLDTAKLFRQVFDQSISGAQSLLPQEFQQLSAAARLQLFEQTYNATLGRIATLSPEIQKVIMISIGLLIFLTMKGTLGFGNWLVLIVGSLIFQILKSAKFYKIETESREKEIIIL